MNQPKFKFGDKLKVSAPSYDPFIVNRIEWNKHYGQYEYNETALESSVELYQEPQKKKLYAYKVLHNIQKNNKSEWVSGHKVTFFTDIDMEQVGDFKRAPEYDIEYPENLK